MKKIFIASYSLLIVGILATLCTKKKTSSWETTYPASTRKIRFQLYTNQDFSGNTSLISFSLFIRNASKTILDSSLTTMQIKDLPDAEHKLVIEKTVNDNSDVAAGFHYEIQNVGNSSYIDTSKAGNLFKIIDFAFQ
ncbi:MAG TPA: hypothetical protein VFP87_12760 [Chitinophagaceae bacterium]|nr:hypothetical protein [Chitinophagaceae bacterium]